MEVIAECKKLISKYPQGQNSSSLKIKHNHLVMLLRETEMIAKYWETHKMSSYPKASQIEKYLLSLKNSK